jgi:hypothetical protein
MKESESRWLVIKIEFELGYKPEALPLDLILNENIVVLTDS